MEIYRYTRKDNPNYRVSNIFTSMNRRAWNRDGKNPAYKNIGICEEWDFKKRPFNEALADFVLWAWTHGYNDTLSIDRIDNSKGYSPDNCQWANRTTQNRNRSVNHPVVVSGTEYKTLSEAIEALNREADTKTIQSRIYQYGYDPDRAFSEPIADNQGTSITVNGTTFQSVREACKALGLKVSTVCTYKTKHRITYEEAINHYLKQA